MKKVKCLTCGIEFEFDSISTEKSAIINIKENSKTKMIAKLECPNGHTHKYEV